LFGVEDLCPLRPEVEVQLSVSELERGDKL
jgi:hypothetical protein